MVTFIPDLKDDHYRHRPSVCDAEEIRKLCVLTPVLLTGVCLQDSVPLSTLVLGDPSNTAPNTLAQRLGNVCFFFQFGVSA